MLNGYNWPVDIFKGSFAKITPVSGFDVSNLDNARQNNYVWSMAEMGDYLYVGTGRNIFYSIATSGLVGDIPVPPVLSPINVDMGGEIWRFHKSGAGGWQKVYKAPPEPMNIGFRYMVRYTTPGGETALYAGALTPLSPDLLILKSTDGINWFPLDSKILGYSTRYMVEHRGKLYMGALPLVRMGEFRLYCSSDPEGDGWELVDVSGEPGKNPRGNIDLLLSYNNRLYVGTGLPTGFDLWRTRGVVPERDNWKLVVDKGAGDARNEHPWSLGVFKNHIYIGTAIEAAVFSLNPDAPMVPPKGFDVIRVNRNDKWELIVGGTPVIPTQPVTGARGRPLSGYPSGFGDASNAYCWQIQEHGNELYLGTFSWSVLIPPYIPLLPQILSKVLESFEGQDQLKGFLDVLADYLKSVNKVDPFLNDLIKNQLSGVVASYIQSIGHRIMGFDLWKTGDGKHWVPVSLNGLGNPYNYGVRILFVTDEGKLYLGTANPFQGCEVWEKQKTY